MHLTSLELRSAPGLPQPITLTDLEAGLVLLSGPNASGKSTLGRVLRGTLWPRHAPEHIDARTTWRSATSSPLLQATLVFGRTGWTGAAPQLAEELAANSQLSLQDLLQGDASSDAEIARQIQTQLDGGYDLSRLTPAKKPRLRPSRGLKSSLQTASSELSSQLNATSALAEQEAQLADLERQAKDAAAAPARIEAVKRALRRVEVLGALEAVQRELDELPSTLESLPEHAADTAKELRATASRREREYSTRRDARDLALATARGLAFPAGDPGDAVISDLVTRAEALARSAAEHGAAARQTTALRGRVEELQRQVWSDTLPDGLPDQALLETLSAAVIDREAARSRLAALSPPDPLSPAPPPAKERERLRAARELLRHWLSAPRPLTVPPAERPSPVPTAVLLTVTVVLLAVGLLTALVGLLLAFVVHPWAGLPVVALGLGLAGLGLGLWLGPRLSPRPTTAPPASEVEAIERRYTERVYPPVESWTSAAVQQVIENIEEELHAHDQAVLAAEEARRRTQERQDAQTKLSGLEELVARTAASLGLAPDLPDLALPVQASRVLALADARVEYRAADSAYQAEDAALQARASALRAAIQGLRVTPLPALDTAEGLQAAARELRARHLRWRTATDKLGTAERELLAARQERDHAQTQLSTHLSACHVSLDELDLLREREAQRHLWLEATAQRRDLTRELELLTQALPDSLPSTTEELTEELTRQEHLAAHLKEVTDSISRVQTQLHEATHGRSIADAIAARDTALDALITDRDTHLALHATQALSAWLQGHRSQDDAPALLLRARRWFLRFTQNRYELQVSPAGGFRAIDTHTDRQQALSELSDGTRVQLLLAARLAFVEHAERAGEQTPLFLDEVLSTTDPERFQAVATAVLELAADGRQVFYATASTAELAAWEQVAHDGGFAAPQVVRLGRASTEEEWLDPPALPAPPPELPPPGDLDAIGYIAALGLPRPTLHSSVETWPLPLVLYDRLPAAHLAARAGLTRISHLKLAEAGVVLPLSDEDLAVARGRAQAIQGALEALRIGRGRPVTWDEVAASGAITKTFRERVQEQLKLHSGDAEEFLQAIEQLRGFRSKRLAQLTEYLESTGAVDPREPLSVEAVVEAAQRGSHEALATGVLNLKEVKGMVALVREVVGGAGGL